MGLHDVFRVRSPVTNGLRTVLLHKQRLRGGVVGWGQWAVGAAKVLELCRGGPRDCYESTAHRLSP